MKEKKYPYSLLQCIVLAFLLPFSLYAQIDKKESASSDKHNSRINKCNQEWDFLALVSKTPADVIELFQKAGMHPEEHKLTLKEQAIVTEAFSKLPPLHKKILKEHLKSISFLDNMPNTALTSTLNPDDEFKTFHIAFRAGILHQTASEWLTEKERKTFIYDDSSYSITMEGGDLPAFLYVLIHEGTHVVDGSLGLLADKKQNTKPDSSAFSFTKGVWQERTVFTKAINDSLFLKNGFRRGGEATSVKNAVKLYTLLKTTPLLSLYSSSSWHEDLAEYITVYHLTQRLKQPFRIVVHKDGKKVFRYDPMTNKSVLNRKGIASIFYS
ncbi:hypothetical protein [Chryseosolibacter indicus]|uniref:Secreted protein n=1 Tax=Chryseosolibacter indicus TaxID=2782351 RepID=A0ABS5VSL0_9BACT|nr:hypothetical protein [Chryseosolibacter indicus]MBT1704428.1 hypothetical protein [Chryseosolibacter indicus]